MTDSTRRAVIFSAGGAGLAAVLSACSGGDSTATTEAAPAGDQPAAGGGEIAKTSDIPVGGGKVFKDQDVVVTQPEAGTFKAFSATCTHKSCPVGSVANNEIVCPCHGSRFSAKDGSVTNPPANKPLAEKKITVSGDSITLA
ncbi:Rieske 2Fe-2S domain-containing protein [Microbispora triticiradicis]|uniref:Rieske 2Fe-2S domain-containing protein n=1 Tax=Microbispora triticiradicis TaxID=2200763 RepID=UPI001AD64020|nr:Rieske 2Fe-2S domain-containing protein [Microbispora triticiradicis]MBO4272350.1 Rieske 2Fe-2S domain-containing protein [Microbispora triticiradicis]